MSDYGDDYSDYGDEWYYVEDEYMAADDLAEHAVASPPPTTYGDEDMLPDWDRFDYFNDIEYASDGYDDATFQPHDAKNSKIGQKRKREGNKTRSKKRQRTAASAQDTDYSHVAVHPPIVWRSQNVRDQKPKVFEEDAPSYALMKDWRETLNNTPRWARGAPRQKPRSVQAQVREAEDELIGVAADVVSPTSELLEAAAAIDENEDEAGSEAGRDIEISQDAVMAALQRQLAAAGGPLSGMDPQQLLDFAMRMANGQDAGDDIAGEMADAMLEGDEEEDDAVAEENLLSWVAQQRNSNQGNSKPEPPEPTRSDKSPPTPPSSEARRTIVTSDKSKTWSAKEARAAPSLKRKATPEDEDGDASQTTKKRTTRSFEAPTASSQAKNAPSRNTRTAKAKR